MVIMHPPGSRPGISSLAIIPAISPKTIQLSIPTATPLPYVLAHLRLLRSTALYCTRTRRCDSDARKASGGRAVTLRHRLETVEHCAVRLHGLQGETRAVHAHQHRVVGGPRASCQPVHAGRVEPPASSPAHDVGNALYGHGPLVDVVVAREDEIHAVLREDWREVFPHPLVAAVPRRTVGGPVQERDPPALARGGQVSLQEAPLLLRIRTPITVIQLAVKRDEVGISPVEG